MSHGKHETYFRSVMAFDDISYLSPMCAAYNAFARRVVAFVYRATLDEVVLHYSDCTYPSTKKNACGPEFILMTIPLPGLGAAIHLWMMARDGA